MQARLVVGSGFGAQLTWTLPFGVLIMFAVLQPLRPPSYEEAARDLGASPWQVVRHVTLPVILPGVIGIALFGFSLSYDEAARTLLTAGSTNTLPLEIVGMTTNVTSRCSTPWVRSRLQCRWSRSAAASLRYGRCGGGLHNGVRSPISRQRWPRFRCLGSRAARLAAGAFPRSQ